MKIGDKEIDAKDLQTLLSIPNVNVRNSTEGNGIVLSSNRKTFHVDELLILLDAAVNLGFKSAKADIITETIELLWD